MAKTVTLESAIQKITVGVPGPTGAQGETGATGAAGQDVNGANETETAQDATGGGTVTLDVSNTNVKVITTDDTAFTIAMSNAPATGNARGITLLFLFTAALPTVTWPTLANTAPDLSGATATTGQAVCEMAYLNDEWWAWLVEAI